MIIDILQGNFFMQIFMGGLSVFSTIRQAICPLSLVIQLSSTRYMKALNIYCDDNDMAMESDRNIKITDWQQLVNKPVYTTDGREVGIVRTVEPENLMVDSGPITPDKYLIPKSSIINFERGIVNLDKDSKFVEGNYKFE